MNKRPKAVTIEPEVCAYCKQELVFEEGVGHLPHSHKSVVTNKKGEPYVVAWDGPNMAYVFHPNALEFYTVTVDFLGNLTCHHRSDYEASKGTEGRCWPYYSKGTCPHGDATQASIDAGERPQQKAPEPDGEERERKARKFVSMWDDVA